MIYSAYKGGFGNMLFELIGFMSFAKDNNSEFGFINTKENIDYLNIEVVANPKLDYANEYEFIFERYSVPAPLEFTKHTYMSFGYEPIEYVDGAFYDGFFQSELYFKDNREYILDTIKPTEEIKGYISEKYVNLLTKEKTVVVHVRRGDYVQRQCYHTLLDTNYYRQAISFFDEDSNFIFFSDDIAWCKENFNHLENVFFIEGEKDYIDFFLMMSFDDYIISNSSFGWLGAWFSTRKQTKKVIGPNNWFGPCMASGMSRDIIPNNWIKI